MRAARVLDLLLVLQARGRRMTAAELAALLEVSERTVLRDVDALSEAGVPVRTSRGAGGGIELLSGFETRLTGLTPEEARALPLIGEPRVAHRLGLAAAARSARYKVVNALPPGLAAEAERLDSWFLHDPEPAGGAGPAARDLQRIAGSIERRRRIELGWADRPAVLVEPLGLVLAAGAWHLVVAPGDRSAVLPLAGLRSTRLTTQRFAPPPGFALATAWAARLAAAAD